MFFQWRPVCGRLEMQQPPRILGRILGRQANFQRPSIFYHLIFSYDSELFKCNSFSLFTKFLKNIRLLWNTRIFFQISETLNIILKWHVWTSHEELGRGYAQERQVKRQSGCRKHHIRIGRHLHYNAGSESRVHPALTDSMAAKSSWKYPTRTLWITKFNETR